MMMNVLGFRLREEEEPSQHPNPSSNLELELDWTNPEEMDRCLKGDQGAKLA